MTSHIPELFHHFRGLFHQVTLFCLFALRWFRAFFSLAANLRGGCPAVLSNSLRAPCGRSVLRVTRRARANELAPEPKALNVLDEACLYYHYLLLLLSLLFARRRASRSPVFHQRSRRSGPNARKNVKKRTEKCKRNDERASSLSPCRRLFRVFFTVYLLSFSNIYAVSLTQVTIERT